MPTITPFLWFDGRVGEAVDFYTSVFRVSAVLDTTPSLEGAPGPVRELMMPRFRLAGPELMALNRGQHHSLTPAFSLLVSCADQAEVDCYWDHRCKGGEPSRCSWLVDRFGLSWQVVPEALGRLIGDPDPERSARVVQVAVPPTG